MDVELPDGTVIEGVPEGTTKVQLMDRIMKAQASGMEIATPEKAPDRFGPTGMGTRAIKQFGHGIVGGTAALPGNLEAMSLRDEPAYPGGPAIAKSTGLPRSSDINNLLAKIGIDLNVPPPKDAAERYLDKASEFGGGMVLGPGQKAGETLGLIGPALKRILTGVGAGVAGQGAREAAGGYQDKGWVPKTDIAGTTAEILALLGPGYAMARTPNVVKALKPALEDTSIPRVPFEYSGPKNELGIGDKLREAADKRDRAAQTLGTRVLLPQAMEGDTQMAGVLNQMAVSPAGGDVRTVLANQLAAAMGKGKSLAESPTSLATGFAEENRIAEAGKKAVGLPAKERTAATKPLFEASKQEPFDIKMLPVLIKMVEDARIAETMPQASAAGKAMTQAEKKLKSLLREGTGEPAVPPTFKQVAGKLQLESGEPAMVRTVMTDPGTPAIPGRMVTSSDVGRFAKEAGTKASSLYTAGKDTSSATALKTVKEILDDELTNYPAFQSAKDEYAKLSGPVQEMNISPMQNAFPRAMRTSGRGDYDTFTRFLLDPNTKADSITEVAKHLRGQDPEAFPLMVKNAWTNALEAASTEVGGKVPQLAPGTFAKVIAGPEGSEARKKFHTIMQELGMDANTANRTIEALEVTSAGRGGVGSIDPKWFAHSTGSNPLSTAMRAPGVIVGGSPAAAAMERIVSSKVMGKIADLLTDPAKVEELVKISRYSRSDQQFRTLFTGLMGLSAAHSPAEKVAQ